jgi:hypothetical protein
VIAVWPVFSTMMRGRRRVISGRFGKVRVVDGGEQGQLDEPGL